MRISIKPSGLKLGAYFHSLQMWNDCHCSLGLQYAEIINDTYGY